MAVSRRRPGLTRAEYFRYIEHYHGGWVKLVSFDGKVLKVEHMITDYHFDNLSAKLNMIKSHIAMDAEEGDFTDWERNMDRRFFKGNVAGA